ncbi:MAG: CcmD family protein, partial [Coriobacteriales bacterium]|nr:CcmD family protein [Coriobacteriales bacterium]
ILADIYSTVVPSAPYIIAAYALIWVALLVYVVFVVKGLRKTEREMAALEALIAKGRTQE